MSRKKNYKEVLTTPFETKIKNFSHVAKYFLYYAPNIDTAHSVGKIEGKQAIEVYNQMILYANMKKHSKVMQKIQLNSWKSQDLSEEILDFEKPRMIINRYSNESELSALLRHIRNALAHGNLYIWRKNTGDCIFMIDYDCKKMRTTAKIMISFKILEQWKTILENEIAIGE